MRHGGTSHSQVAETQPLQTPTPHTPMESNRRTPLVCHGCSCERTNKHEHASHQQHTQHATTFDTSNTAGTTHIPPEHGDTSPPSPTRLQPPQNTTLGSTTDDTDWTSDAPLVADNNANPQRTPPSDPRLPTNHALQNLAPATTHATPINPRPTNTPIHHHHAPTSAAPRPQTRSTGNERTNTNPPINERNASNLTTSTPRQPDTTGARTRTATPAHTADDPMQWHQVSRTRSRKLPQASQPITQRATLQRSGSRTRKPKAPNNKFSPLEFQVIPSFEDDDAQPIEITLPTKPTKPPRRKYKPARRAVTSQAMTALSHQQQVRHPAQTLQHLSPKQTQVVIRSSDPVLAPIREKLIHQIALLRAARTNITPHHIPLEQIADDVFMEHVKARLSYCNNTPKCSKYTEIDIPLRAILDQDEMRVRASICFAWVDLATRAVLPHLYDAWPDQPVWQSTPLTWLPADDEEVLCLQDESLAALAACPSLRSIWAHLASSTPPLTSAIKTAANQWHLHNTNSQDIRAPELVQTPAI